MNQKIGWSLVFCLLLPWTALAEGPFELSYGLNGDIWTSNYAQPYTGYEAYLPITGSFQIDPQWKVYAQTELAAGSYTDSYAGPETITLANISDTVLGGTYSFKTFGLPSLVNLALNLPTGDPTWESKEYYSEVPTEFVDSHYRGRGFGVDALYGISLPETKGEYGVAVGYLYSGAFNPSYGLNYSKSTSLNLGNAMFLAFNHIQPDNKDLSEIARFSVYYSQATVVNGQDVFQLGTNFTGSYGWINPKAFSLEIGAQAYLPSQRLDTNNVFGTEAHNSYAPRFTVTPSYAWGDFVLAGLVKYIMPNDYSTLDTNYDGGGFLVGIEPSYKIKFDKDTSFKIGLSFDDIYALNFGVDNLGNRTNVNYELWNLTTVYELKI